MADKRTTPEAPQEAHDPKHEAADGGPRRKKRTPPTIDLTAQEIIEGGPGSAKPEQGSSSEVAGEQNSADSTDRSQSGPGATEVPHNGARIDTKLVTNLGAGFAGGMLVALIAAALWFAGLVPVRTVGPEASADRLAAMESTLRNLQNRAAETTDTKTIEALSGRITNIEQRLAGLSTQDPAVAERLAAADNAMKSLGVALAALNRRSDDVAANASKALDRADATEKALTELRTSIEALRNISAGIKPDALDAIEKRLASLEQSNKRTSEEISRTTAVDVPARLALSTAGLRDAVVRGAPFAAELAVVKSLGADSQALTPLEPFAAGGVPDEKTLASELGGVVPSMLKISGAKPSGGFLDRLQANADRLVRIRPVDAPPGDEPSAVLARIEIAAAHADISAALSELSRLPDRIRAPASDWIAKARGRQAALAAARQLAAGAARALGSR